MVFYENTKLYERLKELAIIPEDKLDDALSESVSRNIGLHEVKLPPFSRPIYNKNKLTLFK